MEIWTGGGSRKPVNFGDLRDRNLSNTMFELMDKQCPPSKWSSGRGRCTNDDWMEFYTNAVTKKDPWKVQLRPAWIRTNWAQWDNEAIRIVLMQIAADTLRQFTTLMPDFNCYDVDSPYWVKGTYCNVPQFIKVSGLPTTSKVTQYSNLQRQVNLPDTSPFRDQPKGTVGNDGEPPKGNYWHLETWGANADQRWQFTEIGELKPCATRYMVDKVMDKYQNDIVKQFPDYKGKFTRDARVIINGDKVCSDEL